MRLRGCHADRACGARRCHGHRYNRSARLFRLSDGWQKTIPHRRRLKARPSKRNGRSLSVQLDLFLDSRAVVLANVAVRAIVERDGSRAMRCVRELRAEAADYPSLRSLEILAHAL